MGKWLAGILAAIIVSVVSAVLIKHFTVDDQMAGVTIEGTVSSDSSKPIAGASVRFEADNTETVNQTSDSDGVYSFAIAGEIVPVNPKFTVEAAGYQGETHRVKIGRGIQQVNFTLSPLIGGRPSAGARQPIHVPIVHFSTSSLKRKPIFIKVKKPQ